MDSWQDRMSLLCLADGLQTQEPKAWNPAARGCIGAKNGLIRSRVYVRLRSVRNPQGAEQKGL